MRRVLCGLIGLCGVAALVWAAPVWADDAYERPYEVVDGKVDQATYNGFRRYHASCHVCHGPDGLGSSYAPNLLDSLKVMDRDAFNDVVINGRENLAAGQEKVMPAFGAVEDVALYLDDIYAYLKARSDGVLPRGRPQRMAASG